MVKIDLKDKDYFYFCFRATIKKFIFYVWVTFPIPWISNLAFRVCGMKADFKSTLFDGWLDTEFIEFGKNIMVGQGALILSNIIIGDYMLLKKVKIGDHCVIGGYAVARITVEDCLKRVPNRFMLVNVAAKRVRQIREGSDYLVSSPKNEDIVVSLREIAAGKVRIERKESEEEKEA